jgi:hypothetical protein
LHIPHVVSAWSYIRALWFTIVPISKITYVFVWSYFSISEIMMCALVLSY